MSNIQVTGNIIYLDTENPPLQYYNVGDITGCSPETHLLHNTQYFWRVVPHNENGEWGQCPVRTFTTQGQQPNPAFCNSPENNAESISITPTLVWEPDLEGFTPTGYKVRIIGTSVTDVGNVTSWTVTSNLSQNTWINWRVIPYNEHGDAPNCPTWRFKTVQVLPNPVTYIYPDHDAVNIPLNPLFEWEPSNEGHSPIGYKVTLSTISQYITQTTDIGNITNWMSDTLLEPNTRYWFLARPYTEYGNSYNYMTRTFTTGDYLNSPNPAVIVYPLDNSTEIPLNVELDWESGGGFPEGYKVYFGATNPPTQMIDVGQDTVWDSNEVMLYFNRQYFWQVIPYNSGGDAENCPVWSFTTMAEVSD
jgi:hypothetical protein